jgi:hypothetical protein
MLLFSCSINHYGSFSSKDLRINLNPLFGRYEFSCGYLGPMPAGHSCGEVYTQYSLRVRYSIRRVALLRIKRSLGCDYSVIKCHLMIRAIQPSI